MSVHELVNFLKESRKGDKIFGSAKNHTFSIKINNTGAQMSDTFYYMT